MAKHSISRRGFLQAGAAGAAYALIPGSAMGANDQVNVGIIGFGGKGSGHYNSFSDLPNVKVAAVCDADSEQMAKLPPDVARHQDLRALIDMNDIDAVIIATPNHWHSLAAIMACQAGKHVYVEKPVSHHIWEGRQMVNAARKYDRVVQAGTQQRSCPAVQECAADVQSGKYGKVLWAHTSKLGAREPIGKADGPLDIPANIDYNMWAGPAPMTPVMRKSFHYDWHWQWNWGDGEMGNWAIHYLDDLRHILGWDDVPGNIISAGNRWWDDDGQTPNMHMALMEHRGVNVVVDIRNMWDYTRRDKSGAIMHKARGGNYIYCEDAYISISRGGGKAYSHDGEMLKQYKGNGGAGHAQNFIDGVRAGSPDGLACEAEVGHLSTAMCHLANIAWRIGSEAPLEEVRASMSEHEDALNTIESMVTQINPEVDFKKQPFRLGPKLTYDTKTERFTGAHAGEANKFVRLPSREPFVVPEIS